MVAPPSHRRVPIAIEFRGRKNAFIFAVGAVLIVLSCVLAWRTQQAAKAAREMVAHSLQVRAQLREITKLLNVIRDDALEFVMTGDPVYRGIYQADRADLQRDSATVAQLTLENAREQNLLAAIAAQEVLQLALDERLIHGTPQEARLMPPHPNLRQIQDLVTQILAEEDRVLPASLAEGARLNQVGGWLFVAMVSVAVFYLIYSNVRIRRMYTREQAAVKTAESALEAKMRFLAVMSHEVRTPISGILGFADQLAEQPLPPAQEECVRHIQESGQSLLCIVNDILDYSWMQSGKLRLNEEPFSLRTLVEGVRNQLALGGVKAGVAFTVEIGEDIPNRLVGDRERLRQILTNFGANALKFTEKGSVTLGVRAAAGGGALEFYVRDTGIGIAPEKIETIFEPFVQAEETTGRHYGGTGLGLTIAEKLTTLMGGELRVTSIPGKGSEFTCVLALPVAAAESAADDLTSEPLNADFARRHPLSILVAEDDRLNSRVILHLLGRLGYAAEHAWHGREAVERATRNRPQCLLMDLHMPGLDGLDATRAIRAHEQAAGLPPIHIIALTADILPKAQQDCAAAGMSDYLSKPVNLRELANALLRCS